MEKGSFLQEFVAGNIGGVIGMTCVYPLDTAKMRMQTHGQYTGTLDVMRKMTQADKFTSLYRGLSSPAMGFGLTFAVSFSSYGFCCRQIADIKNTSLDRLDGWDLFTAGAVTGAIQSPFRAVVDRVKSVMQVRETTSGKAPYSWSGACAAGLVRKDGFRVGLFQGFSSVLLREIPQFAVYYPSYEFLKKWMTDLDALSPMMIQMLAGGTAGTIQWFPPFYCADVVKSRMQTAPAGFYSSMLDCSSRLLKEEGMQVFFRGLTPALLRAFPLHAIIFCGYETTMKYLNA